LPRVQRSYEVFYRYNLLPALKKPGVNEKGL